MGLPLLTLTAMFFLPLRKLITSPDIFSASAPRRYRDKGFIVMLRDWSQEQAWKCCLDPLNNCHPGDVAAFASQLQILGIAGIVY